MYITILKGNNPAASVVLLVVSSTSGWDFFGWGGVVVCSLIDFLRKWELLRLSLSMIIHSLSDT